MMLHKKVYIGAQYEHRKITGSINIKKEGKRLDFGMDNLEYLEYEVIYWRKANAIHAWFVRTVQDNVDDCGTYPVTHEQLKELLDLCKETVKALENATPIETKNQKVLTPDGLIDEEVSIYDPKVVEGLLEPTGGFFFGNTDIDQWYVDSLKNTIHLLEVEMESVNNSNNNNDHVDYTYHSSW